MKAFLKADRKVGIALHRTAAALAQYHPKEVEIVNTIGDADFQLVHVIGKACLGQIQVPHYAIWMHCYKSAGTHGWNDEWAKAVKVYSTYDLVAESGADIPNFVLTPLGYDPALFYPEALPKRYMALTTGYVSSTEMIESLFEAVRTVGGEMVHVGPDFRWGKGYVHKNGLSDAEMRQLYCESKVVNGMRICEGFELPALEALACGTPAILLDMPCYRLWYDGLAVHWVDLQRDIHEQLVNILSGPKKDVISYPPYDWQGVAGLFWDKVLE